MNQNSWFSKETNRFYQLIGNPPTLKISGVPMHRHIKITPLKDTELKIDAIKPRGIVLDTCTGLGYTAIYSARIDDVKKVFTIERDSNVIEIAKLNSYSAELFSNLKIEIINDDVFEKIKTFKDRMFDTIIHDPPTLALARELYSRSFSKELFRVLKNDGKLWHYAPEPGKMTGRNNLKETIMLNLKQAGFRKVFYDPKSMGVIAIK